MTNNNVAVVVGSSRAGRICPEIAAATALRLSEDASLHCELVDLAEVALPFLDEPKPPAYGHYVHEHTRRWSEQVLQYDAFVFVMPQYNWGYPAVLKNALDFLYAEWAGKPAGIVSYGHHGGGRAAAQLQVVLRGLKMRPIEEPVLLTVPIDSTLGLAPAGGIDDALLNGAGALRTLATQLNALLCPAAA